MNEEKEQHLFENLYKRIGSLERENSAIVTNLESLTRAVNTLSTDVRQIKDNSRTNWGVLASWASVILLIMGVYGNLVIKPIESRLSTIEDDLNSRRGVRWNLSDQIRFEEKYEEDKHLIRVSIDKLDQILQREMRDLDVILQREIALESGILQERLNGLEQRLENAEKHTKELGHPYIQTERVNQLEMRMDDKTYSRFTAHEGELHEKRMDSLENRIGAIESK